jgi:hypothetical protein
MIGYGQLHRVMMRYGITLSGLVTAEARAAMHSLESVYGFAVLATMMLCQWFGAWLLLWHLGFDPNEYAHLWYGLFWVLWAVSFGLYLGTAMWPSLVFEKRLELLHGGVEARKALDQQLADAKSDRSALEKLVDEGAWRRREDLAEVDQFIGELTDRRFRSVLLRPTLLYGFVAWNLVSVIGPWLVVSG